MKHQAVVNSSRFFVRMPRYVGQWLRRKYMPENERLAPIRLPWLSTPAGAIVYQRAVSNAEIRKLTSMCYSAQMFCMDPYDVPPERQADFPSDALMKEYVAIALPAPHYYNGVWIDDNETMQLDQHDTQAFNDALLVEFWSDHDAFWDEYQRTWSASHPGRHCSYYDCLLDFMVFWCINLDEEEALYRAAKRRRKAMRESMDK